MLLKLVFRTLKRGVPVVLHRLSLIKAIPKSGHFSSIVSKTHSYRTTCVNSSISNWHGGQSMIYYVDRYGVQHFKPPWYLRWLKHRRNMLIFAAMGALCCGVFIYRKMETKPYTNKRHFVLLPRRLEMWLGEHVFKLMKDEDLRGKILPPEHPKSVRVRLISDNIINALYRRFDVPRYVKGDKGMDDSHAHQKGTTSVRRHLEGMNWEVIVVEEPILNAFCLPGGKIVLYTGLLKHFKTDVEIATIIGHEVAHALARHTAERITKHLWFLFQRRILREFVTPPLVKILSSIFLELPYSRRKELEADYIGLLLMASAGYDPRVAPMVYKKMGSISGRSGNDYLSTHPSATKRAKLLSQDKLMNEALSIYSGPEKETAYHEWYLLRFFKAFAQKLNLPKV